MTGPDEARCFEPLEVTASRRNQFPESAHGPLPLALAGDAPGLGLSRAGPGVTGTVTGGGGHTGTGIPPARVTVALSLAPRRAAQ